MANYVNTRTSFEILDGQLLTTTSVPADATLIMDVAEKGPTGLVYYAADGKEASAIFGANSPLIQSMQKASKTGVQNILLFRVGGTAPTLRNIFGLDTSITLTNASIAADVNVKVYVGPEPTNPALDCVIVFDRDRIVFSNTLADPVDLNVVYVEGFDKTANNVYLGSITNPVPFTQASKEIGERITRTSTTTTIQLGTTYDETKVSVYSKTVKANGVRLRSSQYSFSTDAGGETTLTITDPAYQGVSPLFVEYSYVNRFEVKEIKSQAQFSTLADAKVVLTSTFDVRNAKHSLSVTDSEGKKVKARESEYIITKDGNQYTVQLTILPEGLKEGDSDLEFVHYDLEDEVTESMNDFSYFSGEDLMNASYKELYEAFDRSFTEMEVTSIKTLIMPDVVNVPNIANKDKDADRLDYLYKTISDEDEIKYEWSTTKFLYKKGEGATYKVEEADITSNGQPIILKRYGHVDFTHRAGMWALESTTENGIFPNISIGVKGPERNDVRSVARWVGKPPTRDLEGKIIDNGTGLLGHYLMVGTTEYRGGYFATTDGFVDGSLLTDQGGFIIDLGKYLSIVVSQTLPANSALGSVIRSGAAEYAGLIDNLVPGNGTTNKPVPNTYLVSNIKGNRIKELSEAGYVVFRNSLDRGLIVHSGDLATRDNSDYDFVGTSIMVSGVVRDLNEITGPFLGQGIDGYLMISLQTALTSRMAARQKEGWYNAFKLYVTQSGPHSVRINYSVTAKDELREIIGTLKLNRQMFTDVLESQG